MGCPFSLSFFPGRLKGMELLGGHGVETAVQQGAVVPAAVLAHGALIVEAALFKDVYKRQG